MRALLLVPLIAASALFSADADACAMYAPDRIELVAEVQEQPSMEDLFAEIDGEIEQAEDAEAETEDPIVDAEVELIEGKQAS